ncbi:MAG: 50S ribosomal protein L5 [Candidatus Magasanikbacteria bacterium]|nr:50S ribosomal protein L5 [Candidatus Magasanikbacteria bacterium]
MNSPLYKMYTEIVVPALKAEGGYKNVMQVPQIKKVVLNVGYGRHAKDKQYIERVERTLTLVTGQKPVRNKATKSISNFKIRQGMEIGSSVTLRGDHMYNFLYRLINLTLPRVRDFRGLTAKSFDRQGNYALGLKEQLAFPEISGDAADSIHGLQIIITTSARTQKEGLALLKKIGFPFTQK